MAAALACLSLRSPPPSRAPLAGEARLPVLAVGCAAAAARRRLLPKGRAAARRRGGGAHARPRGGRRLRVGALCARDPGAARALYPLAVTCFGAAGELALMEDAVREMARHGLPVDSATGNAFVCHYAASGTVPQMEAAYRRLKASRLLVSVAAIRAMASAYISHRKYYKLGEFVTDMKSLQRAFLDMVAAGFTPDLTTFNLRAVAFSKMCMFWDLHLTADHMRRDGVAPDLVTHGCFVDAYLERRLARNLNFAFDRLGAGEPVVATDAVVFEAFGKGGFHASSEVLLEATGGERRWTYYKLLGVYLRKQHRKNQIFWNY
ncbi:hypothetical protein OsJ_27961 [Oryza sativa Japonica Group]|uniref:Uncharacterized protein n=1 Tax=Oryza sativa subsp. japonica TaxID=39947 RepID=A3BUX2_ORYSJ|nr:hypothetical protein OsJ_27961 [Oryza sativa Japonica Group]